MLQKTHYIHTLMPYEKAYHRMAIYGFFPHGSRLTIRVLGGETVQHSLVDYYGKARIRKKLFESFRVGQKFEVYVDYDQKIIELRPIG